MPTSSISYQHDDYQYTGYGVTKQYWSNHYPDPNQANWGSQQTDVVIAGAKEIDIPGAYGSKTRTDTVRTFWADSEEYTSGSGVYNDWELVKCTIVTNYWNSGTTGDPDGTATGPTYTVEATCETEWDNANLADLNGVEAGWARSQSWTNAGYTYTAYAYYNQQADASGLDDYEPLWLEWVWYDMDAEEEEVSDSEIDVPAALYTEYFYPGTGEYMRRENPDCWSYEE
jgi:hypothetical protein